MPLLKDDYEKNAADAKAENPDWNELSKRTIGLLSLEVIIQEDHTWDQGECIRRGINDFYTSVNRPVSEIPKLAWLDDKDIEPQI